MPNQEAQNPNSLGKLAIDVGWSTISTVFLVVAGLGLNVIVGNLFGEDGLGVYSLATGIYLFTSSLSTFGHAPALIKYTAEFMNEDGIGEQYFSASAVFVLVSGVAACGVLFSAKGLLSTLFGVPELSSLLPILAIALPVFGLNKIVIARLNGCRHMRAMAIAESLRYILLVLLTLGLTYLLNRRLSASIWPFLLAEIGLIVTLGLGTQLWSYFSLKKFAQRIRELTWFGSQMTLARLIAELSGRLDLFLAGYFLTPGEVGLYSVALMLARGLSVLPNALQKVARPVLTDLHARGQVAAMEHFVNKTMQLTMFVLSLMVTMMVVFFQPVVRLIYPGQTAFLDAQSSFNVLATGFLFRSSALTVASIYASVGRPDIELKIMPILLIINLVVSSLLVTPLGLDGIAAGAASAALAVFVLWTGLMRPVVGIELDYGSLLVFPLMALVIIVTTHLLEPYLPQTLSAPILLGVFALVVVRMRRLDRYVCRLLRQLQGE